MYSNWENVKASDAIRLLFTEVVVPTLGMYKLKEDLIYFNSQLPTLNSFDSKTQLLKLFEGLLLLSLS